MKIALISDIHGNCDALLAVLADMAREGVDSVINAGDTLGGPLASARTAEVLMQRDIPMIAGNHERQLLTLPPEQLNPSDACTHLEINDAQRAWLATAPPTCWLGDEVFVCHGTPDSDLHYWLETVTDDFGQRGSRGVRAATEAEITERLGQGAHVEQACLIVCGHTHVPRVVQTRAPVTSRGITLVNPGSVGLQAYEDGHPFEHHIETGSHHARYAIATQSRQGWRVDLRSVAYDAEPMARLAEQRGRPDWAMALRTGRMT